MIRANFNTAMRKGGFAEEIVHKLVESKGYVMYKPTTDKAHAFDRLAIKDKEHVIIIECKAKARRNYYPDTGINEKHYNEYQRISKKHGIPVFLIFVDEMERRIYGNFLSRLIEPRTEGGRAYPLRQKSRNGETIIYFPLSSMQNIADLTDEQVEQLKQDSQRTYEYKPAAKTP